MSTTADISSARKERENIRNSRGKVFEGELFIETGVRDVFDNKLWGSATRRDHNQIPLCRRAAK